MYKFFSRTLKASPSAGGIRTLWKFPDDTSVVSTFGASARSGRGLPGGGVLLPDPDPGFSGFILRIVRYFASGISNTRVIDNHNQSVFGWPTRIYRILTLCWCRSASRRKASKSSNRLLVEEGPDGIGIPFFFNKSIFCLFSADIVPNVVPKARHKTNKI